MGAKIILCEILIIAIALGLAQRIRLPQARGFSPDQAVYTIPAADTTEYYSLK